MRIAEIPERVDPMPRWSFRASDFRCDQPGFP
jgi:hypothetical protein